MAVGDDCSNTMHDCTARYQEEVWKQRAHLPNTCAGRSRCAAVLRCLYHKARLAVDAVDDLDEAVIGSKAL